MRLFRPLLAAAAVSTLLIGAQGASASTASSIPTPKRGEDSASYLCRLLTYLDKSTVCNDIPCGPKSCDVVDTTAYRSSY